MAQAIRHRGGDVERIELLTIPETGARLKCSDMHVYRLIARGELCAVDISDPGAKRSKTRVRSDDLDDFIKSHTRRAGGVVT